MALGTRTIPQQLLAYEVKGGKGLARRKVKKSVEIGEEEREVKEVNLDDGFTGAGGLDIESERRGCSSPQVSFSRQATAYQAAKAEVDSAKTAASH